MTQTRTIRAWSTVLILLFLFSGLLSPQTPLVSDPRLQIAGQPASPLSPDTFARLALIVSGSPDNRIGGYMVQLQTVASELKSIITADMDELKRAEVTLEILYKRILFKYSELQTRVDVALDSGVYNCVSSAILYYYLAASIALDVEGVETPDHSFCTILVGNNRIDVETTNPYGVNPGTKKELSTDPDVQKKFVLVPLTKYRNRKPIGDRRLLTLVYKNRISMLETKGDFFQAVGLALDAHVLQGPDASATELADRFINYAISLSDKGKHTEGINFILSVQDESLDYPGYSQYLSVAAGSLLNEAMQKKDFTLAFDILTRYQTVIEGADYAKMKAMLYMNFVAHTIETGIFTEALRVLEESKQFLGKSDFEKMYVYVYSREADRISKTEDWIEAVQVLDRGLREIPGQKDLLRQKSIYRENFAIEVHNQAVEAFNAGNKAEVKRILAEGLQIIPESTLLKNDQKKLVESTQN